MVFSADSQIYRNLSAKTAEEMPFFGGNAELVMITLIRRNCQYESPRRSCRSSQLRAPGQGIELFCALLQHFGNHDCINGITLTFRRVER